MWGRRRLRCRKKAQQPQRVPSPEPLALLRGLSIRGPNQCLVSQGQTRQVAAIREALIEGLEGIEHATAEVTLSWLQFACIPVPSGYSFLSEMKAYRVTGVVLGTQPGTAVITDPKMR